VFSTFVRAENTTAASQVAYQMIQAPVAMF
jgi:hypothetical protein